MAEMLAAIKQSGPPTKNTPGAVGQDYIDIDTGLRWECVEATSEKFYKQNKVVYNWELRGLDPDFVVDSLTDEKSKVSLPVKLDILGTVVGNKTITGSTKKYLFPSEITLNDGDLYLLVYKYFYNGVADPNKHIVAVSRVSDGEVYWGNTDPDNCVKMDKTGVYDNWLATNDDTTKSIVNVYKVQKTITDEAAYHTMHLEGYDCIAPGIHAHAEGINTVASGMYSHAEGFNTKAAGPKQHVEGSYNIVDEEGKYAHIVGNGTNESDRSNAYTLDWEGNAHFAGNVYACDAELATIPQALYHKLPVDHWVKDGDVYIQTVFYGYLSGTNVYVNPIPGYENEYYNAGIATYYVREDGEFGIRFVAKALPTSDIKVYLISQYFEFNVKTPDFGFMSNSPFTISARKGWNGTIEYVELGNDGFSTKWVEWFGDTITAMEFQTPDGTIYGVQLRGSHNTRITLGNTTAWTITGSNVECIGNIETLLDWKKVAIDEHPTMANYCYSDMFKNCTALVTTPVLPATALTKGCYLNMFNGCTNLTHAPSLPATTLAEDCYRNMFDGCTNLTHAPSLPATTLASNCYSAMFQNCTNLAHAPSLPATTLADHCYNFMFTGCTNLTSIPSLPATALTVGCYAYMFQRCTGLKLSAIQTDTYTKEYHIPATGVGTTANNALSGMFHLAGGTFTGTPDINTMYYLHKDCIIV